MKSTTKIQISILALSAVTAIAFFAVLALAPSIIWTSDSDWSGGTFSNTTSINGDLQLKWNYSAYNNWTYRKAITINGSTSMQNDYQIMINLTNRTAASDNFNFARANSQGNDTRFTWLNASSGLEQNVSFWIENWTASGSLGNATIWVKAPNVTASTVANTTLYMYYGNPSATSASNGTNTFMFFDDFNRADETALGSKWTEYGTQDIYSINGSTLQSGDPTTGTQYMALATSLGSMADVTIRSKIKVTSFSGSNPHIGIIVRAGEGVNGYGVAWYNTITTLQQARAGINWIAGSSTKSEHTLGEWWWIEHQIIGNTLKTKAWEVGTTEPYSWDLTNTVTDWSSGYVGVFTYVDGIVAGNYDDFLVRKYASPEPSMLSVGAEQTAASKGTYLSNTTTASATIGSITPTWNASDTWTRRANITINNSAANQTNYQAFVNVSYASQMRSDYGDLRFYWLNGTTEQKAPYWIENYTSSFASVWINVPFLGNRSNETVYMYYGNPSAASASSGTNTFPFFDDFNRADIATVGNGWTETTDIGSISGNRLRIDGTILNAGGTAVNKGFTGSGIYELTFERDALSTVDMYIFVTDATQDFMLAMGGIVGNNQIYYMQDSWVDSGITIVAGQIYKVKFVVYGNGFVDYWIDNTAIIGKYGKARGYTANTVSFGSWDSGGAFGYVDNTRVRKYASPEPNASVLTVTAGDFRGLDGQNFTVEISANSGANWLTASNNTAYTSGGGIGSGTQMVYRINFSTNDTSRTAILSDITMNYVVANTTLTCDAGGPYLANSTVMITGNVSDGTNALASQPVTVQIKNNTVVLNSTVVTSDASGNWVAKLFVNTTNANSVFVNSTYLSVSGNCTYSLSVQAQTITAANATCTTNSTACAFQAYPVSGWVMDAATGSLISSGTVKLSVKETGDTYSTAFGGGYFSISPQFCLSPGVVYSFALSTEGNGRQGFMTYRRAGKA